MNLVFIGPSGSGKSTMLGHLIADSGTLVPRRAFQTVRPEDQVNQDHETLEHTFEEAKREGQQPFRSSFSSPLGHPERCYAWILDKLGCERQRGNSMYVAMWRLASRRCRFTILDAPGHSDFSKDMVTAMSQAEIAVLVVPAAEELEQEKECKAQLREHSLLAYTLGLRRRGAQKLKGS